MVLWSSLALATTTGGGTTFGCPIGTFPDDGDGPVSPDAVFVGVGLDPRCPGPSDAGLASVVEVTGVVDLPDLRAVRFTPDEPLPRGSEVLAWATDGWSESEVIFEVGRKPDRLPLSPGVAATEIELRRHCSRGRPPRVKATITLEEPAAGVLQAQVLTDGISQGWFSVAAGSAMAPGELAVDVRSGVHDHCVEARLLDELGEVAWIAEPACVQGARCPVPEDRGCSTTLAPRGFQPWILPLLFFFTPVARRR
ncbi:MAG: hypothetical protein KC621_24880 [Myxococcales bacterium]|nr:hypothetical protein [Myxococcales bacterium]